MMLHAHGARLLPLALAATLAACSGRAPVRAVVSPPGVPVPVARADPASFDRVVIGWEPVAGDPLGYELEGAVDGGPWERLHTGLIPADTVAVQVDLSPALPELTTLSFRVRSAGHAMPSDWSAAATFERTLRPPDALYAWQDASGVVLTWQAHSAAQSAWSLERRVVDAAGGTAEDWAALPVPFPADHYTDALPPAFADGASLVYRLRAAAGSARSEAALASRGPAPLLAPSGLSSAPRPGGVALSWTNRSAFATEVAIYRTSLQTGAEQEAALLPAPATAFEDLGLPAGRYRYRVVARRPVPAGPPTLGEAPALLAATGLPPEWGPWTLDTATLPTGLSAVVRGSAWYGAAGVGQPSSGAAVLAPDGQGFARHALADGSKLERLGLLTDPQGRPHVVFAEGPMAWTTPVAVVHEWLDGGTWHREVVAERILSAGDGCQTVRAAVDEAGALHVVWMAGPDPATGLEYATNAGGAWAVERISDALPAARQVRYAQFAVAAAGGEVHVLLNDWGTLWLAARGAAGWSVEAVPAGPVVAGYSDGQLALARAAGETLVTFGGWDAGNLRLYALVRSGPAAGGTWAPADDLGVVQLGYTLRAAASAGGRLAVAFADGAVPRAWLRDAGAWSARRGFDGWGQVEIGFDAAGKAWLLVLDGSGYPATIAAQQLYQEP